MESMRFRCDFSIIFESLWQFWLVIVLIIVNELDSVIEMVQQIGTDGIIAFIKEGGFWGLLVILGVTLVVIGFQFLRWRKTWIILEDNLIILERNTLNKKRNTIAIENISAVNMERNLFERVVGTYRIKMDTNSMTTANETDISIVFREDIAIEFRRLVLERMNSLKGNTEPALSEERQPDQLFESRMEGKAFYHYNFKDMIMHALYAMPLFSLLISIAGIGFTVWYVASFGWSDFIKEALGGFIAIAFIVLGCIWTIVKSFIAYYDFTVYRDGKDIHVRCGLIKLKSYTIPVDKISALEISQPFFSRIFKKYNAKVVTVGVGDEEDESSNITMSLSKEQLKEQLAELVPEYSWADYEGVIPEEKAGMTVRLVKSIKWHLITAAAIIVLMFVLDAPWWIGILIPLALDGFINLMYVLSHKTAGYLLNDEGAVMCDGYFNKRYMVLRYKKAQYMSLTHHPAAKKYGVCDGAVMLLNSASGIPYIKLELADELQKRIIS